MSRLKLVLALLLALVAAAAFVPGASAAVPVASNCMAGITPSVLNTPSGIAVAWTDNCTDEAFFAVIRQENGGPFDVCANCVLPANTTSYVDAAVSCGSTYQYTIRAFTAGFPPTARSSSNPSAIITATAPGCSTGIFRVAALPAREIVCAAAPVQLAFGDGTVTRGPGTLDLDLVQATKLLASGQASHAFFVKGIGVTCDDPAAKYGATAVKDAAGNPQLVNNTGLDLGPSDGGRNYIYYTS